MSSTHHPATAKSLGCVLKLIVCLLLLAAPCHAQQFQIRYSFTGLPGNQVSTLPLADSVPNLLTISGITRSSGITTVAGSGGMAAGGWTTTGFDPNDYFTLNLSSAFGYRVRVDSISFAERRSLTGPGGLELRTSADTFGTGIYSATLPDDSKVRRHDVQTGGIWADETVPLEVRFYGYQAEASGGTWRLGGSTTAADNPNGLSTDLLISGWMEPSATVAPEPASIGLVLACLPALGCIALYRHKTRYLRDAKGG